MFCSFLSLALNVASKEKTHRNMNQAQHMKGVLKESIALLEQVSTVAFLILATLRCMDYQNSQISILEITVHTS